MMTPTHRLSEFCLTRARRGIHGRRPDINRRDRVMWIKRGMTKVNRADELHQTALWTWNIFCNMTEEISHNFLVEKYDVPTPRYTSYPTVPCWRNETFTESQWRQSIRKTFDASNTRGISLYIHLPFCESLCTYCACTTRITRNHKVEAPYLEAVLVEWKSYLDTLKSTPIVREIHLGGGTPTFFSADNLHRLVSSILGDVYRHDDFSCSFEGHPNNTTAAHLSVLYDVGFRRVSFGVQDLDLKVQEAIHRIQPYENLLAVTEQARAAGYTSVSFDLVYGLPFQTVSSVGRTIEQVLALQPDRLAFYSYAHVPWLKPGQRGYSEADLPQGTLKRQLYETGKSMLVKGGYSNIGMDHFALPHDDLFSAHVRGKLHRNFMGYTTSDSDLLIGLGASAISDAYYGYAQNEKRVETYLQAIRETGSAITRGHILTEEELSRRDCILQLSCRELLERELMEKVMNADMECKLRAMEMEGLIDLTEEGLFVTDTGRPFVRNICSVFDQYYGTTGNQSMFSKSI